MLIVVIVSLRLLRWLETCSRCVGEEMERNVGKLESGGAAAAAAAGLAEEAREARSGMASSTRRAPTEY